MVFHPEPKLLSNLPRFEALSQRLDRGNSELLVDAANAFWIQQRVLADRDNIRRCRRTERLQPTRRSCGYHLVNHVSNGVTDSRISRKILAIADQFLDTGT